MPETYDLTGAALPTIPPPHDAIVREIRLEGNDLIFQFEDQLAYYHDAVAFLQPDADSLVIRFHLTEIKDCAVSVQRRGPWFISRFRKPRYVEQKLDALLSLGEQMEYIDHYVSCQQIMIRLFSTKHWVNILVELSATHIDFEWILK